ncbi:MAG: sel1 repeat family protein [Acidobacteriales bacterium]|nr:sel1 repeat family protein [Terriglobales bacterium]
MRRTILTVFFAVLTSALAFAQSTSPEALYERGMDAISGAGPSRNDRDALEYFRRSAELGYGPAQVALGYFYETGTLTAGSQSQAVDWYRKAANHGDVLAQWMLGRSYFNGGGIQQDLNAAQEWFKSAADQGNPFAAYYLARILADRDYAKAPAMYKVAADQGLPPAQYYYAKALKEGRGIELDRFNAYVWFVVALDAGYSTAQRDLAELDGGGFLSAAQIAEAKGKARELEQTVIRAVAARGCTGWDGELNEFPSPPPPKLQRFCR